MLALVPMIISLHIILFITYVKSSISARNTTIINLKVNKRADYVIVQSVVGSSNQNTDSTRSSHRRKLSTQIDYFSGESLVTYNGQVPLVTCPHGTYRPQGSTNLKMVTGQREDGCVPCPKGVYGDSSGLTSPSCTAPCPLGTYSDRPGLTSKSQCTLCPQGTYGSATGLTTNTCSGKCPRGKYSNVYGSITINDCIICPNELQTAQCRWAVQPRAGQDQDHQHREYIGELISTRINLYICLYIITIYILGILHR